MVAITTLVVPSGERLQVKAGVVCLQCENCVIHTLSASAVSFLLWGAKQMSV